MSNLGTHKRPSDAGHYDDRSKRQRVSQNNQNSDHVNFNSVRPRMVDVPQDDMRQLQQTAPAQRYNYQVGPRPTQLQRYPLPTQEARAESDDSLLGPQEYTGSQSTSSPRARLPEDPRQREDDPTERSGEDSEYDSLFEEDDTSKASTSKAAVKEVQQIPQAPQQYGVVEDSVIKQGVSEGSLSNLGELRVTEQPSPLAGGGRKRKTIQESLADQQTPSKKRKTAVGEDLKAPEPPSTQAARPTPAIITHSSQPAPTPTAATGSSTSPILVDDENHSAGNTSGNRGEIIPKDPTAWEHEKFENTTLKNHQATKRLLRLKPEDRGSNTDLGLLTSRDSKLTVMERELGLGKLSRYTWIAKAEHQKLESERIDLDNMDQRAAENRAKATGKKTIGHPRKPLQEVAPLPAEHAPRTASRSQALAQRQNSLKVSDDPQPEDYKLFPGSTSHGTSTARYLCSHDCCLRNLSIVNRPCKHPCRSKGVPWKSLKHSIRKKWCQTHGKVNRAVGDSNGKEVEDPAAGDSALSERQSLAAVSTPPQVRETESNSNAIDSPSTEAVSALELERAMLAEFDEEECLVPNQLEVDEDNTKHQAGADATLPREDASGGCQDAPLAWPGTLLSAEDEAFLAESDDDEDEQVE